MTSPHVVVVHGTRFIPWAKPAWIESGALVDALNERGITHEPFHWSGFNGHGARMRAANRLASALESALDVGDARRVHVVAHSHGGNVALHAIQGEGRSPALSSVGVITLATPFIHFKRDESDWSASAALLGLVVIGLLAIFGAFLPLAWFFDTGSQLDIAQRPTVLGVVWALYGWSIGALWMWGPSESEIAQIQAPAVEIGDVSILRSAGDEASLSLAVSQVLHAFGRFGLAMAALLFFTGVFAGQLWPVSLEFWAILMVTVAVASLVRFLLPCAFGLDGMSLATSGNFSAEPTPPGEAKVIQLATSSASWVRLSHSSLYQTPEAIIKVTRLIGSR